MAKSSPFWATICGAAVSPVALAAGVAGGALRSASGGGPFAEGFEGTAKPIIQTAEKFGNDHGETITKGLLGGAAAALGGRIINESIKHVARG
jgi:hypothetical protein